MIRGIEGKGIFRDTQDRKDFVTRLGDLSEQTGNRQGNSKKGGRGSKVLFFHYVPQSSRPPILRIFLFSFSDSQADETFALALPQKKEGA
jgi:hypothetical protein